MASYSMAATDESQLTAELNKLRKHELIELIIHKKLPESVSSSELLNVAVKSFHDSLLKERNEGFIGDNVVNTSGSPDCVECRILQREINLYKKLTSQLEGRTSDQSDLIRLLKKGNNAAASKHCEAVEYEISRISDSDSVTSAVITGDKTVNAEKTKTDKRSTRKPSAGLSQSVVNKQRQMTPSAVRRRVNFNDINSAPDKGSVISRRNVSAEIYAESQDVISKCADLESNIGANNCAESEGKWQDVKNKKRRRTVLVGDNKDYANVRGVPRYVYLHIYRVDPKTTADDLADMLRINFPEVKCENLTSRHPDLYASFKVAIYNSNFKAAMDATLWPYGACVSRFLFPRREKVPAAR